MARYSRQRERILNLLKEHPIHPSADEIYHMARAEDPGISLGTVYRNLNYLSENGYILKIHVPDAADRFDYRTKAHHHMLCRRCGRVYDLPDELESVSRVREEIQAKAGMECLQLHLLAEGICQNCQLGIK